MPIESNIDEVGSWMRRVIQGINMEMPGPTSILGHDIGVAAAEGIQERSYAEQRGAKEAFRPNSKKYLEEKIELYESDLINVRTGQMLSMGSMTADIEIADEGKTATMTYGSGEPPQYSVNGYIEEEDKAITDKEKAWIAHNDNRSFFELDEEINNNRVLPVVRDALEQYLKEHGGS
jgi:hypothetical protein